MESDAVVVVELLTAIAIRNPHRTARVWPVLHLLERVCVNLMRGCATMPSTDDVVFSSLTMLTQLRPDTTEIVAPRIAAVCRVGVSLLRSGGCVTMNDPAPWVVDLALYCYCCSLVHLWSGHWDQLNVRCLFACIPSLHSRIGVFLHPIYWLIDRASAS